MLCISTIVAVVQLSAHQRRHSSRWRLPSHQLFLASNFARLSKKRFGFHHQQTCAQNLPSSRRVRPSLDPLSVRKTGKESDHTFTHFTAVTGLWSLPSTLIGSPIVQFHSDRLSGFCFACCWIFSSCTEPSVNISARMASPTEPLGLAFASCNFSSHVSPMTVQSDHEMSAIQFAGDPIDKDANR